MATVNCKNVILNDLWPGLPNPKLGIPTDGWDGSVSGCMSTPVYPIGTKISAYSDGTYCPGMYTMMYLRFIESSDHAYDTGDISDMNNICCHAEGTDTVDTASSADATVSQWWNVTNSLAKSDATNNAVGAAVATRAYSTGEYGWFWVGGVCPYADVTKFDNLTGGDGAEFKTGGNVNIGYGLVLCSDGTTAIALDGTIADGTLEQRTIGWATATDA